MLKKINQKNKEENKQDEQDQKVAKSLNGRY